ncbi:hypothetical protein B0H14DRAFT_3426294 [Mycena olivaceomarginata]|nr:hypothetical protein B0H14DRAFT_3426294 [Mycena olivaceomarginata]
MSDDSSNDVRAVRLPRLASSRLCIMHLSTCWAVDGLPLPQRVDAHQRGPPHLIFITPSPPLAYLGTTPAYANNHPHNTPPNTKHTNTDTSIDAHRSEIARGAPAQSHHSARVPRGHGEAIAVDTGYALCAVPGRGATGANSAAWLEWMWGHFPACTAWPMTIP